MTSADFPELGDVETVELQKWGIFFFFLPSLIIAMSPYPERCLTYIKLKYMLKERMKKILQKEPFYW